MTRSPDSRRVRWAPVALAGAAAGLVVAVVLAFSSGDTPGAAERAYAAITKPGRLYHLVADGIYRGPEKLVGPTTRYRLDAYYDTGLPANRTRQYKLTPDGPKLYAESTVGPGGSKAYMRGIGILRDEDAAEPYDPLAEFKRAYEDGDVRSEGHVTVDGRDAYELVVDRDNSGAGTKILDRTTYIVDADTYLPIEYRNQGTIDGKPYDGTLTYTTTETLPRTKANLAKLEFRGP